MRTNYAALKIVIPSPNVIISEFSAPKNCITFGMVSWTKQFIVRILRQRKKQSAPIEQCVEHHSYPEITVRERRFVWMFKKKVIHCICMVWHKCPVSLYKRSHGQIHKLKRHFNRAKTSIINLSKSSSNRPMWTNEHQHLLELMRFFFVKFAECSREGVSIFDSKKFFENN